MKKLVWTITSFLTLLPFATIAHEGHGVVNVGPAHYVLTPEHGLPIVVVAAVAGYFIGKKILKKT